jgi:hypothetical protein
MEYHMETREITTEEGNKLRNVRNSLIIIAFLLSAIVRGLWFFNLARPVLLTINLILVVAIIYCVYKIWEFSIDLYFGTKEVIKGLVVDRFGSAKEDSGSLFYKIGSKSFRTEKKLGYADIGDMVEVQITRHSRFMFSFRKV